MATEKQTIKPATKTEAIDVVFGEFFQDYTKRRWDVYKLNFVRGIFFGLGTFIGGTLVIAAVFWFLSLFEQVPYLSDVIQSIQNTIEDPRNQRNF